MGIFDFLKKVTDDNANENVSQTQPQGPVAGTFRYTVQDVFTITGRGTVVTGMVEAGQVSVGDVVQLRRVNGEFRNVTIGGLEVFRKMLDTATAGMNVGILVRDVTKEDIGRGDVLER